MPAWGSYSWPVTAESQVRSQVIPCLICVVQIGTMTGFFPTVLRVSPVVIPWTLCNISNWQHRSITHLKCAFRDIYTELHASSWRSHEELQQVKFLWTWALLVLASWRISFAVQCAWPTSSEVLVHSFSLVSATGTTPLSLYLHEMDCASQ